MSDVNPTTTHNRDAFGPVGAQPTFQEPSDYERGQHVVFHHFDGKDYEAVITDVWEPGSDVANRWSVHLDVGKIGKLKNIVEGTGLSGDNSFSGQPSVEGTFSLKPKADPTTKDDDLVANQRVGTEVPVRADLNPRPPAGEPERLRIEDFDISAAPSDAPQEPYVADPFEEVRDDQVHNEQDAENTGDEGLDTPANLVTDNRTEQGDPIPDTHPETKIGTTRSDDDEHVKQTKSGRPAKS